VCIICSKNQGASIKGSLVILNKYMYNNIYNNIIILYKKLNTFLRLLVFGNVFVSVSVRMSVL